MKIDRTPSSPRLSETLTVEQAHEILDLLGCSSDPLRLGWRDRPGEVDLDLFTLVYGESTLDVEGRRDACAKRVRIRFWSDIGIVRGTVYSMVLDRLDAMSHRRRRAKRKSARD